MKYTLLLFDADDTLFDYKKGENYAFSNTFSDFRLDVDLKKAKNLYKVFNKQAWKDFEKNRITADELKIKRFKLLFDELSLDVSPQEFSDAYLDHLSNSTFLFNGVEELINDLAGKVTMCIITNGLKRVQRPRFDRSSIGRYFKEYIISEEIGMQKPDESIFQYTFEKLNHTDKEECLIIGDNLTSDILGGIRFGIDTCWFNPNFGENTTGLKPTYEINYLDDLRSILLNQS
jgi:2-haloacid dehalogenase